MYRCGKCHYCKVGKGMCDRVLLAAILVGLALTTVMLLLALRANNWSVLS